jgi:hypothetical protein
LREKCALKVSEKVMWRIFMPKKDETGYGRKLHNMKLHSLYPYPDIICCDFSFSQQQV